MSEPKLGQTRTGAYHTLDAWRGLAALAVVLYHATNILKAQNDSLAVNSFYYILGYGYLGVLCFFVISGYCIAAACASHTKRGLPLSSFVRARVRRIFPPYWIALIFAFILAMMASVAVRVGILSSSKMADRFALENAHGIPGYFANICLLHGFVQAPCLLEVSWTLCYEVAFYAICSCALFIAGRKRGSLDSRPTLVATPLVLLHILTFVTLLWQLLGISRLPMPLDLWPAFGLGCLLFDVVYTGGKAQRYALYAVLILLACVAVINSSATVGFGINLLSLRVCALTTFCFTTVLWWLHQYDQKLLTFKVLQWLAAMGIFSYSLYLVHFPLLSLINPVLSRFTKKHDLHYISLILMTGVCVVVAALYYQTVERRFISARRIAENAATG